jgi:hypothetical protein
MTIVGERPETGVRVELERDEAPDPPWEYRGEVVTPDARFEITVAISAEGEVRVALAADAPPGLAEKLRLLARTLWRHAQAEGAPPPRRLLRWRPEA